MPKTPANIRNIALTGHAASGKTSLLEQLLHKAGAIGKAGTIEEGNTVSDFEQEERDHQHSLYSSVAHCEYQDRHLNFVDTPGFPDFIGQAIAAMPAVETVAVVIGADRGIQTTTRRIMQVAADRRLPRMIIINKIDEHLSDLPELLESVREEFGSECLPVNLPSGDGSGVVDLWEKSDGDVSFSSVGEAHTRIVDQCVEVDEALMEKYLEQGELTREQLHGAFELALRQGHLVPVCFCSARTGVGLEELLHVITDLSPSPEEGNPRPFLVRESEDAEEVVWEGKPDPSLPLVAHVFKVTTDQFVGKLALVRIHQGTLRHGDQVHVDGERKPVRVAHLHAVSGKDHHEVQEAVPGDIVALTKIEEVHFNSVLHNTGSHSIRFKPLPIPRPMYGLAIEAKSRGDEVKIGGALTKLCEEDPTFAIERVAATKQTVARAMGELHMRVLLERLNHRFKLELNTEPPKVAYKETIAGRAEGHHRHKKQTGGAGQFGEVYLRVEPLNNGVEEPEAGLEFVDATVGGSIPRQFMPAIEKGVKQAMVNGCVAGYPLSGVKVEVYDGKHHPVDSKEVAFITAGKRAFIDAVKKARPVIMEPVVELEITAPASAMGDITSDLSGKRGQVIDTQVLPGDLCRIKAKAPLAELNTYSNQLKSMTGGQGSYVMDYSHDEQTPPNVQQEIIAAFKPEDEED